MNLEDTVMVSEMGISMGLFLVAGISVHSRSRQLSRYFDAKEELAELQRLMWDYYDFKVLQIWQLWDPLVLQATKSDLTLQERRRRVIVSLWGLPLAQMIALIIFLDCCFFLDLIK